jgi:hypothetical protein
MRLDPFGIMRSERIREYACGASNVLVAKSPVKHVIEWQVFPRVRCDATRANVPSWGKSLTPNHIQDLCNVRKANAGGSGDLAEVGRAVCCELGIC